MHYELIYITLRKFYIKTCSICYPNQHSLHMNNRRKFRGLIVIIALFMIPGGTFAQKIFRDWPLGNEPAVIGLYVANHYVASNFANFGSSEPPTSITYPEVCTWYGALQFAKVTNNKQLTEKLVLRFEPLLAQSHHMMPKADNVEHSVFGAVPMELYLQTNQNRFLDVGKPFADDEWTLPEAPKPEQQVLAGRGLSWQSRMTVEDMYMITLLQVQAFRATGTKEYINRAATEMSVYIDALQQPTGLFNHAAEAPIYWCRGNGWAAASMALILTYLPNDNPNRAKILDSYKKMMGALKQYVNSTYQWRQVMDDDKAWAETSGSGMFTYALIQGVKKEWLDDKEYGMLARNSWMALVKDLNEAGDAKDVCEETARKKEAEYYLNRERTTGSLNGLAPVLWCAVALLTSN